MKKTIYFVVGGIVAVVLLAGGAFMAMRLLNAKAQNIAGAGGNKGLMLQSNGPGGKQSVYMKQIPAPELPKQTPDMRGQIVSIQNNSIFVAQQDKFTVAVKNGVVQQQPTPVGPYTEVVVSKETKIYRDVTMENMPKPSGNSSPDNPVEIQQKVEPVDVSGIASGSMVQVWGQRRGDRLIADVLVVSGMAVIGGKP